MYYTYTLLHVYMYIYKLKLYTCTYACMRFNMFEQYVCFVIYSMYILQYFCFTVNYWKSVFIYTRDYSLWSMSCQAYIHHIHTYIHTYIHTLFIFQNLMCTTGFNLKLFISDDLVISAVSVSLKLLMQAEGCSTGSILTAGSGCCCRQDCRAAPARTLRPCVTAAS